MDAISNNRSYNENFRVRYSEADRNGFFRNESYFDIFQEVASKHAEILGCGMHAMGSLTWVLSKIRIEIARNISVGTEFKVTTWPSGVKRLYATREAVFEDAQGEFARCSSYWLLIDLNTLRPMRLPDALEGLGLSLPDNSDKPCFFDLSARETACEGIHPMAAEVLEHEIDVNVHLNNARYISRTSDWLCKETGKCVAIESITANYLHAVLAGTVLETSGILNDDGHFSVTINGPDESGKQICRFSAIGCIRI